MPNYSKNKQPGPQQRRKGRLKKHSPQPTANTSPKLLDQARGILRAKRYSYKTEQSYIQWMRRFIKFHNTRHPKEMGETEINQFLTHLAVKENVAASTQNQALCAIIFYNAPQI